MKFNIYLLLFSLLPAPIALAGQITGTLFKDGEPANAVKVQLSCDKTIIGSAVLDATATFSFYVPNSGVCSFDVVELGLSHKVYSYQNPVYYNFDLIRQTDGSYLLRRH